MVASRSDMYLVSQDTVFQHRVQSSLIAACVSISNEGWTVPFHRERANFVTSILQSLNTASSWTPLFAEAVSTDANVISDATQAGTVVITSGNSASQAALVTDAHIDVAISSMFNSFIRVPGN